LGATNIDSQETNRWVKITAYKQRKHGLVKTVLPKDLNFMDFISI